MNKTFQKHVPIPGPRPLPLLGNLLDFDLSNITKSLDDLSKAYGPIYALTFGSSTEIIVTSRRIAVELCDERRFSKLVTGGLEKMKPVVGDGLFTSHSDNPKWQIAHRIVLPLFGTLKIRDMFDDMKDICEQMCLKWARFGSSVPLDVCRNFTTLTLDTISLCTINYRFNSFYLGKDENPFVESVVAVMNDTFTQSNLPDFVNKWFRFRSMAVFQKHADNLRNRTKEIIDDRRKNPVEGNDLLNAMLTARDPKTGQKLSEESVVDNLLTFLIAGHETTSSLLSFCFYYLLEYPEVLEKARKEVDSVIGDGSINVDHLQKLPYIESILRETLRLRDPGPGFYVKPLQDEVLGGEYFVKKDQPIFIVFDSVHRDPDSYGSDADEFKPDRMSQKNFDNLPPCSWKPFGNGLRSCIGRPFAWQQSLLVVAMILQNFDLIKDDSYKLKYQVTMTVRPIDFYMKIRLRNGIRTTKFAEKLYSTPDGSPGKPPQVVLPLFQPSVGSENPGGQQITILYASNAGSCESLAHRLASDATEQAIRTKSVDKVNTAIGKLPKDTPVIIITASYDGEPADDAVEFVSWLESLNGGELEGVSFAVFGCGHRDWASTLFVIPGKIDALMAKAGARRLVPMGTADSAVSDMFSDLETWTIKHLWKQLTHDDRIKKPGDNHSKIGAGLQVSLGEPPRVTMRKGFAPAVVTESLLLSKTGVPAKRHLKIRLPLGFDYQAGDHLHILPRNSPEDVQRVLSRFCLEGDAMITLTAMRSLVLPPGIPITVSDLFGAYVELKQTASPKNIQALADTVGDDDDDDSNDTRATLQALAGDLFKAEIQDKHISVMDLLDKFPKAAPSLTLFLSMLTQMRPRTYSFSSSPKWEHGYATLTYTVVGSSQQQDSEDVVHGIASNYLSKLDVGRVLYVALQPAHPDFRLPAGSLNPVIMVAAGTGLAPFRGFIQDRRIAVQSGGRIGPALLFYGCRGRELDDLYRSEFDESERQSVVKVIRSYSREVNGRFKYIDEQIRACSDEIASLWSKGAIVRICGGKKMSNSVFDALAPILFHQDELESKTNLLDIKAWKEHLPRGRYIEEIFI